MFDVEDFSEEVSICREGGGGGHAGGGGGVIGRSASPKSAGRSEKSSSFERPEVVVDDDGFLFELDDVEDDVSPGLIPLSENSRFIGGGVHCVRVLPRFPFLESATIEEPAPPEAFLF